MKCIFEAVFTGGKRSKFNKMIDVYKFVLAWQSVGGMEG